MLTEKAAQLACEDGYTFTVVNGSGTTKERSKCGKNPLKSSPLLKNIAKLSDLLPTTNG